MKYLVCDSWGNELESFNSDAQRIEWLKKYCYYSGAYWMIYDLSRFPYEVSSRTLVLDEEQ